MEGGGRWQGGMPNKEYQETPRWKGKGGKGKRGGKQDGPQGKGNTQIAARGGDRLQTLPQGHQ